MRRTALLACVLLSGCSGEVAFVESFPADIRKTSTVYICYDKWATKEQIEELAREACARIDKEPKYQGAYRHQCRLLAPHRATYRCVAPKKEEEGGEG